MARRTRSRKHMKKGGARKTARRHHKKGGMLGALSGMVQTALVPFGLYAAQKIVQRRKNTSRKGRK